ncbi:MAG: methyltransferase domain-containing protein [Anaerolineae bacterium]|nr:methyltransferase domain-containing protein [Anaerolineae bacterium]
MAHEFDGRKYEKASAHQQEWGERLVAELDLKGTERVLDLGCGDGRVTAQLAALAPDGEVVGIDASRGMIEVAREKTGQNLSFRLLDIDHLDYEDAFDVVFSNATLHWVLDHHRFLLNVRRALRKDGVLRFNFGGEGNCAHLIRVVKETMALPAFAAQFAGFRWPWFMPSIETYAGLAMAAGLRDVRVWGENADRYFPDTAMLLRWVDQPCLVPFLPHVAGADREAFRSHVHARMIEETLQPDGRCFETFRRVNVFARK